MSVHSDSSSSRLSQFSDSSESVSEITKTVGSVPNIPCLHEGTDDPWSNEASTMLEKCELGGLLSRNYSFGKSKVKMRLTQPLHKLNERSEADHDSSELPRDESFPPDVREMIHKLSQVLEDVQGRYPELSVIEQNVTLLEDMCRQVSLMFIDGCFLF